MKIIYTLLLAFAYSFLAIALIGIIIIFLPFEVGKINNGEWLLFVLYVLCIWPAYLVLDRASKLDTQHKK